MLINLCYVAEWSHAVQDKPVKARLLGRDFVLFRDSSGVVNCLSDVGLHRGGSLSGGWTRGDCVACPYHGWRFNGNGKVEHIQYPPQLKENFLRRRIRKERQPTVTKPAYDLSGMVVRIQIDLNERMSLLMFDANTPVDEHTTRTFALQFRNFFKNRLFDNGSRKRLRKILAEDTVIVDAAAPNYLPDNLANELSVKDDKFMSSFRAARRRCIEERGWKIDSMQANRFSGRKVLAIPSPLRRERRDLEWVIDTVPLVAPIREPVKATGT